MKKKNVCFASAVIVAAGKGTRMNMDINKQYIDLGGMPLLARTIKVFEENSAIDEIILVVNGEDILWCRKNIVGSYGFSKVRAIVAGGSERQASVYNGLCEVNSGCGVVLIHDGARPFIRDAAIISSIDAAREFGAAAVAVPVKDTIKEATSEGLVGRTLDRSLLWAVQTPQTFRYGLILDAHRRALEQGYTGTDDTVLVERLGYAAKLVMGSYDNIKITTVEDLAVAEAILKDRTT